jgi:hypothetical protein
MTTPIHKKQLHKSIYAMPDGGFLKAMYALFKEYSVTYDSGYVLSQAQKEELDKQKKRHIASQRCVKWQFPA